MLFLHGDLSCVLRPSSGSCAPVDLLGAMFANFYPGRVPVVLLRLSYICSGLCSFGPSEVFECVGSHF